MNQHQQNERTAGNASQAAVCNMLFSNISAFLRACEKSSEERRNQLYTPALIAQIVFLIKEFAESCKWDWNRISQHPQVTFPAFPDREALQTQENVSLAVFFIESSWFFFSVRREAFQMGACSPVRCWPDVLHGGSALWAIMELLLKLLAELAANSFCMIFWRGKKKVLLSFQRRSKTVRWTLSVFVLLITHFSKGCAVLFRRNLFFQMRRLKVGCSAAQVVRPRSGTWCAGKILLFDSSENICLPYLTSTHLSG